MKATLKKDFPDHVKVLTTTWAMKKKANGVHRVRVVAQGFEQEDGMHFDTESIAAHVVSNFTI